MANEDEKSPAQTSLAYDLMVPQWRKIDSLLGGTESMRAAGREYLPQHPEETNNAYTERLATAFLLNMCKMTLDSWVGKPFSDPIVVGPDVPTEISDLFDDVDLQGSKLDVFARNWFRDGVAKAYSHVLVEYPRPPATDGPRTLADDRLEKIRPYLVHIRPENLIFAHVTIVNGVEVCDHVRIREQIIEVVGWEEVVIQQIRVITPGLVQIWRLKRTKGRKEVWVLHEQYDYALDFVPLVTFYSDRQGYMIGNSPLGDLADLNVAHWQSTSDQRTILTVSRFPVLGVSGAISDDKLTVGPHQWLHCPDPAGRFYYVEHTGKAIAAGRQDLLDLEEVMAEYGAVFLKKRPGGASATARALDTAETTSPLQDMTIRFNAALNQVLDYMGHWMDIQEAGGVKINIDFGLDHGEATLLMECREARQFGDISRDRYIEELKRMGALGDDFDAAKNKTELDGEKKIADEQAAKDAKMQADTAVAVAGAKAAARPPAGKGVKSKKKPAAK